MSKVYKSVLLAVLCAMVVVIGVNAGDVLVDQMPPTTNAKVADQLPPTNNSVVLVADQLPPTNSVTPIIS